MKLKQKLVYSENYRAPGLKLRATHLPELRHTTFVAVEVYITKAGRIERDGEVLEFQDVRIYLREGAALPAEEAVEERTDMNG